MPRSRLAGLAMGGLGLLIVAAVSMGGTTRHVELNFGPGDTPFVSGFQEDSDVDNKVGWHWTSYHAAVDLPLRAEGSDLLVNLRYARMFGEEAVVELRVGGVPTPAFRARGGEVRTTPLRASGVSGALVVGVTVDSHERRDMGLRMDRISIDAVSGPPLRLRPLAAALPVAAEALLIAGLLLLGASPFLTGSAALGAGLLFGSLATMDLFQAWRLVRLVPAMILVALPVLGLGRLWLERRMRIERPAAVLLATAALVSMVFRLGLVSQPDFYYPDLLTHARVADAIRNEGPGFLLHPADALNAQGAWTKPVLGSQSSLPYAIVFHLPFAVLASWFSLSLDQIETAMKAVSTLISVLPILLTAALAARLGLPPLSALVLCIIPTYTSRLSFGLLPALTGHVFDLGALLAVTVALDRDAKSRRSGALVTLALLAGHLSYTSSVVNEGLFMAILVLLYGSTTPGGVVVAARLAVAEGLAAILAFALYYHHFVGDVAGLFGRLLGLGTGAAASAASVYPIESFWGLLFERTQSFFGWPYVGLFVLGLWLVGSAAWRHRVLPAWGLTYLALILLRAKIPDVFRYGHETLFLTPMVGLLAGSALILAHGRGGGRRLAVWAVGIPLAAVSLWQQLRAVAEQLGNAL